MGRELRLLEAAVEMDHHRVVDVLRILPVRRWVRDDGTLDASAAMRLALLKRRPGPRAGRRSRGY